MLWSVSDCSRHLLSCGTYDESCSSGTHVLLQGIEQLIEFVYLSLASMWQCSLLVSATEYWYANDLCSFSLSSGGECSLVSRREAFQSGRERTVPSSVVNSSNALNKNVYRNRSDNCFISLQSVSRSPNDNSVRSNRVVIKNAMSSC